MTDAELTILSLVAEGPRYGYEIQQIIDERGLREWLTIGFSSIYYVLNKLESQGMLTSELRMEGRGPARKIYRLTEAGHGVLQTAVADLLRQSRSLGSGFELGLANLNALKPQQVYRVLTYHRDDLRGRLQAVESSWGHHQQEDAPDVADHIRALYTHSIALMTAELEWLEMFIEDWRERYDLQERNIAPEDASEQSPDSHLASTIRHQKPPSEPAKMIQRLRRPPRPRET